MQKQTVCDMQAIPLFDNLQAFLIRATLFRQDYYCPFVECRKGFAGEDPKTLIVNVVDHLQEQHGL